MHRLVEQAGGRVVGTVVIADGLGDGRVRRELRLTSLVRAHELWH